MGSGLNHRGLRSRAGREHRTRTRPPIISLWAETAIPQLAALYPHDKGERIDTNPAGSMSADPAQLLLLEKAG